MSIYSGSFIKPRGRQYEDGRDRAESAISKILHQGPQRPDSLMKRADSEAVADMLRTTEERDPSLTAIRKAHESGRRPGLPNHEAEGDEPDGSRSVNRIKHAHGYPVHSTAADPVGVCELTKAFAEKAQDIDLDEIEPYRGYATGFRPMTPLEKRAHRKALSMPGQDNDIDNRGGYANTGASNNFRDNAAPTVRPTLVGGQPIGTPSTSDRDAAIDAIKKDLMRPKRMPLRADEE